MSEAGPLQTTTLDRIAGHVWTISPFVHRWVSPHDAPPATRWWRVASAGGAKVCSSTVAAGDYRISASNERP